MAIVRAASFAALLLCTLAGFGMAQDVTLVSRDGNVEISGNLVGFDGEFYRVDTVYGELTVDGSGVVCEGPGCPDLEAFVARVTFSGAPTVGRVLMPALLEAFAIRHSYEAGREIISDREAIYRITDPAQDNRVLGEFRFRLNNTDEGFADLLADEADIVMALREVRREEVERGEEAGIGDLSSRNGSRVIALDALVPVVAPSNPVQSVSMPELVRVMTGEIDNWEVLGGPNAPIAVHVHGPRSGLGQATEDRLLKPAFKSLLEAVTFHPAGEGLAEAVAADPFAIGGDQPVGNGRGVGAGDTGGVRVCLAGWAAGGQDRGLPADFADVPVPAGTAVSQAGARVPRLSAGSVGAACDAAGRVCRSGAGGDTDSPAGGPVCQCDRKGGRGDVAGGVAADGGVPDAA